MKLHHIIVLFLIALASRESTAATDSEIDKLVYELYGLTAEEISIIEN